MIRAPAFLILALVGLALFGSWSRTYALDPTVACVYKMAELDAPAADILFVGTSRTGRGIDPIYVQGRLASAHGLDLKVERIALPNAYSQQYRPVLQRYLDRRGAPKVVFLQLLYNFRPERHHEMDMPLNPPRNLAFASVSDLMEIRRGAQLNDYDTVLPRSFQQGYAAIPAMLLNRLEMNIYAALKYPAQVLSGQTTACTGEVLYRHNHPIRLYGDITDAAAFTPETEARKARRLALEKVTAQYLPLDPTGPMRRFENGQIQATIKKLQAAGSRVVLYYLPALGETVLPDAVIQDFAVLFPGTEFEHPMSLYEGPLGAQLAVSYVDTHHVDHFGALQFSRYFVDVARKYAP